MAVLNRMDWYDLARSTNWTPKYVTEDELFPPAVGRIRSAPESSPPTATLPMAVRAMKKGVEQAGRGRPRHLGR